MRRGTCRGPAEAKDRNLRQNHEHRISEATSACPLAASGQADSFPSGGGHTRLRAGCLRVRYGCCPVCEPGHSVSYVEHFSHAYSEGSGSRLCFRDRHATCSNAGAYANPCCGVALSNACCRPRAHGRRHPSYTGDVNSFATTHAGVAVHEVPLSESRRFGRRCGSSCRRKYRLRIRSVS